MKIQSRFKDYYDFISHRFGQDPNCVYVREPFRVGKGRHIETVDVEVGKNFPYFYQNPYRYRNIGDVSYELEFIVAASHVIPFLRTRVYAGRETFRMITWLEYDQIFGMGWGGKPDRPLVPEGEALADLIRKVGAPVFHLRSNGGYREHTVEVFRRIPVLQDLGFPAVIPAPVMWQDIYTTLSSVLRKDPDKAPPVTLANDDRVHAAGFDLKTSFRHPINRRVKRVKS